MIQRGGRSKKVVGARDESEDEENGLDADFVPEVVESLTLETPPPLASSVLHLDADRASLVPPAESKDNYQDHRAEYPKSVQSNSSLWELSRQRSGERFAENSGNFSWATSNPYGMPGRPPTTYSLDESHNPSDDSYGSPPKQPFRSEGYSANVHSGFSVQQDADLGCSQRGSGWIFPQPSTPGFTPAIQCSPNPMSCHYTHESGHLRPRIWPSYALA